MIARDDLPLGVKFAQTIHAAGESSPGPSLPTDTRAVMLVVPDEASLLELEAKLVAAGVAHSAIREPDAPWLGQLMCIGVQPQPREALRPLLGHLKLLR